MAKILWFDNDEGYIVPFVESLKSAGHSVDCAYTLTEAEEKLSASRFDLLILDSMITTFSEDEESKYPPEETGRGLKTGVCFYLKWRESLKYTNTRVVALTLRMDREIRELFLKAGLPPDNFYQKVDLRKAPIFVRTINTVLNGTP